MLIRARGSARDHRRQGRSSSESGGSALWMNWLTAACFAASVAPMLALRVEYRRLNADSGGREVASGCDRYGCI